MQLHCKSIILWFWHAENVAWFAQNNDTNRFDLERCVLPENNPFEKQGVFLSFTRVDIKGRESSRIAMKLWCSIWSVQWRHDGRDGVSNHRLSIVYSTVYSGTYQRKHQSSAFPFDDAIKEEYIIIWEIFFGGMN